MFIFISLKIRYSIYPIASMKLHSKSYKQIYMEWMQDKTIKNQKLKGFQIFRCYRTACRIRPPPVYPARPADQYQFQFVGVFNRHPNSTQEL